MKGRTVSSGSVVVIEKQGPCSEDSSQTPAIHIQAPSARVKRWVRFRPFGPVNSK